MRGRNARNRRSSLSWSTFGPAGSGQVYLSGSTCPQPPDNTFRLPQIIRLVTRMRIGKQWTKVIQTDAHYANHGEVQYSWRHTFFLYVQSSTGLGETSYGKEKEQCLPSAGTMTWRIIINGQRRPDDNSLDDLNNTTRDPMANNQDWNMMIIYH